MTYTDDELRKAAEVIEDWMFLDAAVEQETPRLTANDPEPAVGTVVDDDCGLRWVHMPEGYWLSTDENQDPESWVKIAGNYGPVRVVEQETPELRPENVRLKNRMTQ